MGKINITTEEAFRDFCERNFPGKAVKWADHFFYVQAGNHLGEDLHYEFYNGRVQLHIEGSDWKGIRDYLRGLIPISKIVPSHWDRNQCCWTLSCEVTDEPTLFECFIEIRNILEPHILNFEAGKEHTGSRKRYEPDMSVNSRIITVAELLELPIDIPPYQRPYRWTEKNVSQLLEDIMMSINEDKSVYRIGSIILHDKDGVMDIVDGQQRITTIMLILMAMGHDVPASKLKYAHRDSYEHIRNNYTFIQDWLEDNVCTDIKDYILKNCELVKIVVTELAEAFQMFDSQNGRGKELEAYNLLKSYHLRAMEQNSQEERIRCDIRWESSIQYDATPMVSEDDNVDILKQLFDEQLYRSRKWARGHAPGRFSKECIAEFKGCTIDRNHQIRFPYQNPHLLQFLTARFYENTLKGTVSTSNRFADGDSDNINPFSNMLQAIVNGKEFFDYIETYVEIYKQLFLNLGSYRLAGFKRFYYSHCLDYDCPLNKVDERRRSPFAHCPKGAARRTGDGYLRELYKSLIMVLFDRFGEKGLNRFYGVLYRLVYMVRITHGQVRHSTVDQLPLKLLDGCFQTICQAKNLAELRQLERMLAVNVGKSIFTNEAAVSGRVCEFIKNGKHGTGEFE